VADFRPKTHTDLKIKKTSDQDGMTLELVQNPDILQRLGEMKRADQFLVGFAAETHDLAANAQKKIKKKNLDMIAANLVGGNKVTLFFRGGAEKDLTLMDKQAVAHTLLDTILEQFP